MSSPAVSTRPPGISGRALAVLIPLVVLLIPALFVAPHALAARRSEAGFAHQRNLVDAVSGGFVEYWSSGRRDATPGMQRVVDYWFRFHAVKAAVAAMLLVVLVVLAVRLWRSYVADGPAAGRRFALASSGVLATTLALGSLVFTMANIQGAVAPLTSALTMLPVSAPHGRLAGSLVQVRHGLAASQQGGHGTPPTLHTMIDDNARYHLAMAVLTGILLVVLVGVSVLLWRRRRAGTASAARRARRVLGSHAVLAAVLALVTLTVMLANMSNAAHPAQGLAAFY